MEIAAAKNVTTLVFTAGKHRICNFPHPGRSLAILLLSRLGLVPKVAARSRNVMPRSPSTVFHLGIVIISQILIFFSLAVFSVFPACLMAQDVKNAGKAEAYEHPGNRYTYENIDTDIPAHWERKITAQFIGISDVEVQKELLLNFLQLSDAGGYSASIQGFPSEEFTQPKVSSDVNFLVMEIDSGDLRRVFSPGSNPELQDIFSQSLNGAAAEVVKKRVVSVSKWCGMRWNATSGNVIDAVVIAMASDVSVDEKVSCLRGLMPRAFGIFSLATKYSIPLVDANGGAKYEVSLSDRSEMVLELEALRACREVIRNPGKTCPFNVISAVFRHHEELRSKYGDG